MAGPGLTTCQVWGAVGRFWLFGLGEVECFFCFWDKGEVKQFFANLALWKTQR